MVKKQRDRESFESYLVPSIRGSYFFKLLSLYDDAFVLLICDFRLEMLSLCELMASSASLLAFLESYKFILVSLLRLFYLDLNEDLTDSRSVECLSNLSNCFFVASLGLSIEVK